MRARNFATKLSALLILSSVAIAMLAAPAAAVKRIVLVIGNGAYEKVGALTNPPNDARLIARTLRGLGFEVIERIDADQKTMKRALRDFGYKLDAAGDDGVGLFYYAGHGLQVNGRNYLIPTSADIQRENDVGIESVAADSVLETMEYARNRLNIVIMDACRNNPYKRGFRSATRGLAKIQATRGTLIAYATAPGNVAADGAGDNSPYTEALARAMNTPGLTVERMFKRVRNNVVKATNERQVPWESSSLVGADFYFKGGAASSAVTPTVSVTPPQTAPGFDARAMELAFWNSIKDSTDPADLEQYLENFPKGLFAGLARNSLKRLRKTTTASLTPPTPSTPSATSIAEVQRRLATLGYRPGSADGAMGRQTRRAIEQFQRSVGLPVTGQASDGLLSSLRKAKPRTAAVVAPPRVMAPKAVMPAVGDYPQRHRPGATFKDCPQCPEMVVVRSGSYFMGSPPGEVGRAAHEGPRHLVTLAAPFAIGRHEVTVAQWRHCVAAGACGFDPTGGKKLAPGSPVSGVSWRDAQQFVLWLGQKSGATYRLPSEAEWEYAARAGTDTPYWWGADLGRNRANCKFCGSRWDGAALAPVGSFPAHTNPVYVLIDGRPIRDADALQALIARMEDSIAHYASDQLIFQSAAYRTRLLERADAALAEFRRRLAEARQ